MLDTTHPVPDSPLLHRPLSTEKAQDSVLPMGRISETQAAGSRDIYPSDKVGIHRLHHDDADRQSSSGKSSLLPDMDAACRFILV